MGGGPGWPLSTNTPEDHAIFSPTKCTGTMPGLRPGAPRLRPIALPSQIPLGTHNDACVTLHPQLRPGTCVRICCQWPPSARRTGMEDLTPRWPQSMLQAPATTPALPSLTLVVRELPWVITVHASSIFGVSIGDVYKAIWEALGMKLDKFHWDEWRVHADAASGSNILQGIVFERGLRRADLLAGQTTFAGLVRAGDEDGDVWTLELEDSEWKMD
uniref:DUF6699 domain-containing protein n=1 Tax=Mycena chlorophos TaxID=658473 RepID=A0ABQ0LIG8_MYCCL|nr:predicted protein [Mycena chlorophos]